MFSGSSSYQNVNKEIINAACEYFYLMNEKTCFRVFKTLNVFGKWKYYPGKEISRVFLYNTNTENLLNEVMDMKKNKRGTVLKWLITVLIVIVMGCQNVSVQDAQGQHDTQQENVDKPESLEVTEFAEDAETEQMTEADGESQVVSEESEPQEIEVFVVEDGTYTSKEEVAVYLYLYGELPDNFITKKEAKALGWVSTEQNLAEVAPGMSIGGDYFGNYEGLLPEDEDRDYYECDINSVDGRRGAERIVYSNDGLIYYTPDHYDSFELLYGEE